MFLELNTYIITFLLILIVFFLGWLYLLFWKNKQALGKSFLGLYTAVLIWMGLDFVSSFSLSETLSVYVWRLTFGASFVLAIFAFRFVIISFKGGINKLIDMFLSLLMVVFVGVTVFTGVIVKTVTTLILPGQINYLPGGGYLIMMILILLPILAGSIYSLIVGVQEKNKTAKARFLLIALVLFITFLLAILSNFGLHVFDIKFNKLTHIGVSISLIVFFYVTFQEKIKKYLVEQLSIRKKIAFYSVLQFLIISFLIVFSANIILGRVFEADIKSNLVSISQSRADHIETYIIQNIERLKLVTSRTKLRNTLNNYNQTPNQADLDAMKGILIDAASSIDEFERICVLGGDGTVITSTDESYCGKNVQNKFFFIEGLNKNSAHLVKENGEYKLFVSGPMKLNNQVLGVGLTVVKLDYLEEIVKARTGFKQTGEVLIAFEDQNEILFPFSRLFEEDAYQDVVGEEEIALPMKIALNGENRVFDDVLDYRGEVVMASAHFIPSANIGLVAKIDRNEAFSNLNKLSAYLLTLIILAVILYYLFSQRTAGYIFKPIFKLKKGVEEIIQGNLDYSVSIEGTDEIAQFSKAFDQMTQAIKDSRSEIDKKVEIQTSEITQSADKLDRQQKAIMNILEDVQEEKQKAESSASDLQKFRMAVEGASDHIVITDPEGKIIFANESVEKITGFSTKEIIGQKAGSDKNWGGHMPRSFYDEMWKTIRDKKKPFGGEINNVKKWGEEYVAFAQITPILNKEGEVEFYVGIERDVTKEKQIDQAKTEFVSIASHQLRTPLSSVKWYAEMLLAGDAGELNQEQIDFVKEISVGNDRMVDLVDALLDVSRIELGTFSIEPQETDLVDLAKDVVKELKGKIQEKKLQVVETYGKGIPKMMVDPRLTRMVFQNLLSNAVKYISTEGRIDLEIKKKGKELVIKVADTGFGIPKSQQDKIFTKLFRADNVKERDTEGTGLGLYIIKSIVEHSGGKIWFESEEEKGTTFYVLLPLTGMQQKKGTKTLGE